MVHAIVILPIYLNKLISKSQALKILHLKHHAYIIILFNTINTPYNWPAFLEAPYLNIGYLPLHELIRIRN